MNKVNLYLLLTILFALLSFFDAVFLLTTQAYEGAIKLLTQETVRAPRLLGGVPSAIFGIISIIFYFLQKNKSQLKKEKIVSNIFV
mgnify:CR=1 FL=1